MSWRRNLKVLVNILVGLYKFYCLNYFYKYHFSNWRPQACCNTWSNALIPCLFILPQKPAVAKSSTWPDLIDFKEFNVEPGLSWNVRFWCLLVSIFRFVSTIIILRITMIKCIKCGVMKPNVVEYENWFDIMLKQVLEHFDWLIGS